MELFNVFSDEGARRWLAELSSQYVAVISICGELQTGKSGLANLLLDEWVNISEKYARRFPSWKYSIAFVFIYFIYIFHILVLHPTMDLRHWFFFAAAT